MTNIFIIIKKYFIISICITTTLFSENAIESISKVTNDNLFITDLEYGQMLYTNPRGIGCIKCHGKYGNKVFIAKFIHKKKERTIYAPQINHLNLQTFSEKLKSGSNTKSIMPTYFLTNKEIQSIYSYISNQKSF